MSFRHFKPNPKLEATPDLTRGEQRFAAEVAIATMRAQFVPCFAYERAVATLTVLARG